MAHRDIKLQNILCLEDGTHIKLCDFGFVIKDAESYVSSRLVGTKLYMAPEQKVKQDKRANDDYVLEHTGTRHQQPLDIWAACVMLYRMVYNHFPFEEQEQIYYGNYP